MATPKWFVYGLQGVMGKVVAGAAIDLDTDTIKFMLATTAPTQATDDFRNDVTEATAPTSGYTSGGYTLASSALSVSSLTVSWDSADISSQAIVGTLAFRYGVFYKSLGGASSADPLIGYVDYGSQSITDATLSLTLTNQLTITAS